jgi:hypothetical protein
MLSLPLSWVERALLRTLLAGRTRSSIFSQLPFVGRCQTTYSANRVRVVDSPGAFGTSQCPRRVVADATLDGTVELTIRSHPRTDSPETGRKTEWVARRNFRKEMKWITQHQAEYSGQWVALDGDRLLSHSHDSGELLESVARSGVEVPFVVRIVSSEDKPLFVGW